jgi:hypothetical protein
VGKVSGREKAEEITRIEVEMLLKKVEGLLKIYKAINEGKIVGKVEIEKQGSVVKVKLLNPEMVYDPIMEVEFDQSESIGELYNKIMSDELKEIIVRELGEPVLKVAHFVLEQARKLENCADDEDWY